jgi:hypothetical protein
MCQATGYKLKSNKELPCAYQVFSKLIPMTKNEVTVSGTTLKFTDTVNENQLYPMYSVLEFNHYNFNEYIDGVNVKMCRVTGIFAKDGKDSFTQTSYGKKSTSIQYLLEVKSNTVETILGIVNEGKNEDDKIKIDASNYMYGIWVSEDVYKNSYLDGINKYLYIQY